MTRAPRSLSLVTLFFEAEISLLALQARSMVRFHDPDGFEQVLVIDNTRKGITGRARRRLDAEFGPWRAKVEYVRPERIADLPAMPGWEGQQVLKLMVSRLVATDHYVVLDAKNHWNQPTDYTTFVNPDGRARGASTTYRGHPLESRVAGTMRYFGVDPEAWLDHFPVTFTPVVLERDVVRDMVRAVEQRSGRPFAEEFERAGFLEFPLYACWLIATYGGLDGHVDGSTVRSTTIWPSMDATQIALEVRAATELDSPFLAVHRKALARAGLSASRVLADLWVDRGLFASRREAMAFVATFKATYLLRMSERKARTALARSTARR